MSLTRLAEQERPERPLLTIHRSEPGLEPVSSEPAEVTGQDLTPAVIRYERGSRVFATDGPVGILRQVVIDEDLGEVKALVIREDTRKELVLVPPDLVDSSAEGALLLQVTREQFHAGASRSPRFNRRMFAAADSRRVMSTIPFVFQGDARRSLVRLFRNAVETGASLDTAPRPQARPAPQPRWTLFRRSADAAPVVHSTSAAD